MDARDNPSTISSERADMEYFWTLIADVLDGAQAVRAKQKTYLPKYFDETRAEYKRRVQSAPWRPEFEDCLRSLASKPFDQDVALSDDISDQIKDLSEDIDGQGNNLTRFAAETFKLGIANGLHVVMVDYPNMGDQADRVTQAEEQQANVRPYWVQIAGPDIIALYTEWRDGQEIPVHFRYRQKITVQDGFSETVQDTIRVYEPGLWEVYTKNPDNDDWSKTDSGEIKRGRDGKDSIAMAIFRTGDRLGTLKVRPPLANLADMQIELYRAGSRKDEVLTYAGSPMLAAEGMAQPTETGAKGEQVPVSVAVGPKRVLFSEANGKWGFVQPDAANITEIRTDVEGIIADMRRLGMQPATRQSGTPTATGESIEAAKAHSACENWASGLKDVLEQLFVFTCEWINDDSEVEVTVNTDFDVMPFAQAPLDTLTTARAAKDISQRTYWDGLRRFDVLRQDFDPDDEEQRLAEEQAALEPDEPMNPITGQPLNDDNPIDVGDKQGPSDFSDAELRSLFGDDIADQAGLAA